MLFIIKEFFGALYPEDVKMVMMFKLAIGMLSVTTADMGYTRNKERLSGWIVVSLILLAGADIVTTINITVGAILHTASYCVLTYAYWTEEEPDRKQVIVQAIMTLFAIGVVISINGDFGWLKLLAALYLLAATAMVCTSFQLPKRVFIGSILLFTSGCLLMANVVRGQTFLSHIISLGTYYLAIGVLASANTRIVIPKLVPEDSLEKEVIEV